MLTFKNLSALSQLVGLSIALALFNFALGPNSNPKQSSPFLASNLQESKQDEVVPARPPELQVNLDGYSFEVDYTSKPFFLGSNEGKELLGYLYYVDAKNIETGQKQRVWQKHYCTTRFVQAKPTSFVIGHRSGSDFAVAYIINARYVKFEEFSARLPAPAPSNIRPSIDVLLKNSTAKTIRKEYQTTNNGPNSFNPRQLAPVGKPGFDGFDVFGGCPTVSKVRFSNGAWEVTVDPASESNLGNGRRLRYQRNKDGKEWKLVKIEEDTKLPSSKE